ncbi:MAG: methyltransferase [Rhodospirillales bacterium]|nr:methyltransferase [Rhodospirillales bacterium]
MAVTKTEQEAFWAGSFGDEYLDRNLKSDTVANRVALFSQILKHAADAESFLELGAGAGFNLKAIRTLRPDASLTAVEINAKAIEELKQIRPAIDVVHRSIISSKPDREYDFVFTRGVLIHIAPDQLPAVYDTLYQSSRQYLCVIEYYSPTPVDCLYRGETEKLFKRDFAGEILNRFPDLALVDYGFVYHRGPYPQDDITWFLMRKPDRAKA